MAQTAPIDTNVLKSGDMIDLEYQIVGSNETMIALAVHSVKQSIASDSRLDYQSGRREYRTDLETGIVYEFLIVTVIVRRYPRGEREPDIQLAGLWVPIAIIVAAASAAVIAYSTAVVYRSYTVHRIATGDQSDAVKQTALGALDQPFDLAGWSWIVPAAIVLGIYWASKSRRE